MMNPATSFAGGNAALTTDVPLRREGARAPGARGRAGVTGTRDACMAQ